MQCPHCGNYVADGATFCTTCGARQEAPATPANPYSQSNPYGQPPVNPYGQSNANPYGQSNPYGQPPVNPYGQPNANPYGQPNPYGNPYGMPDPNMKPAQPYQGYAIASLVLGILSFFCFGIISGALAIAFASIAKNNGNKSGMATAGLVCGIVGLVLTVIGLFAFI